ncbi:hypothetical protein XCR_3553 [Xanthomonas campestris pv. raphani 756C]|nr:hypothetical protein XCR_3553 [Xanthomonas campestris pv. raphani 756C]
MRCSKRLLRPITQHLSPLLAPTCADVQRGHISAMKARQ